jgi:copper chaperone
MSTIATYRVTGMTCGHCVSAVRAELTDLAGVAGVEVELEAGGVSRVLITSAGPLTDEQIAAALDEAGDYQVTGPGADPA